MATAKIRRIAQTQQRRAEKQQRRRLREKKAKAKRCPGRPKQKRYYAKSRFSLKRLKKLLNNIEIVITVALPDEPFTKDPARMYSYYQFRPIEIRLNPDGTLKGGILTFTFAWIDWSFIRLLVTPFYSSTEEGGELWDPVTLFLLDLLRVLLGFSSRAKLLEELRKETPLGRQIAAFVGIDPSASSGQALDHPQDPDHKVPSEMAFTHFCNRIGSVIYEAVFQFMVGLLRQLPVLARGHHHLPGAGLRLSAGGDLGHLPRLRACPGQGTPVKPGMGVSSALSSSSVSGCPMTWKAG